MKTTPGWSPPSFPEVTFILFPFSSEEVKREGLRVEKDGEREGQGCNHPRQIHDSASTIIAWVPQTIQEMWEPTLGQSIIPMMPVYIGYVHDFCCVYTLCFCLLILPIINVLIAVLNKHLTPTPEEFHRCKYVCIIMVLPVKGFIEKGFFSGRGGV